MTKDKAISVFCENAPEFAQATLKREGCLEIGINKAQVFISEGDSILYDILITNENDLVIHNHSDGNVKKCKTKKRIKV